MTPNDTPTSQLFSRLFLRSGIRSIVPCLAIDGNGQSVGKGLLSSMLSLIAYGQDAATTSAPKGREEWASKLDSILLKRHAIPGDRQHHWSF